MRAALRFGGALVAAWILGAGSPALAATDPGSSIVGTLAFTEGGRALSLAEVQRRAGGRRVALSFRKGWVVVGAPLDAEGRFAAKVAPGTWRLEWIDVGDRAEALGGPLQVDVDAGRATCAGRITIAYADVASELGASAAGTVEVARGCPRGAEGLDSAARPAEEWYAPALGFAEFAEGLRIEGRFSDQDPGLRAAVAVPLRRPLAWMGSVVVLAAASRRFATGGPVYAFELGGGFVPYWGAELSAGGRWETGAGGPGAWAALRLGPAPYAFIARVDLADGATWTFGLELSAFHLVGRFL